MGALPLNNHTLILYFLMLPTVLAVCFIREENPCYSLLRRLNSQFLFWRKTFSVFNLPGIVMQDIEINTRLRCRKSPNRLKNRKFPVIFPCSQGIFPVLRELEVGATIVVVLLPA